MPLDFVKTGADTGYNDSNSVQPVSNSEPADQTVFRRPSENIRNRTEVIRRAVDEALAEMSSDRGLMLVSDSADATITWGGPKPSGTGKFTLVGGTDLRIIPVLNPSSGNAKNDIWGRRLYTWSGTKYFTMRSKLRISEGGNNIKTEIFSVDGEVFGGGQAVNVTIEGSKDGGGSYNPLYGPVKVRIQLSKTGGAIQSRWSDVLTGITGNAYSNAWLAAGVTAGEESALAVECTSGYFWESGGAGWTSVSGCDAQAYRITASELSTFFGTATNELYEGDTLFLKFATAQDRLDQAGDTTIGATRLKILHRSEGTEPISPVSQSDSPNLMHCVPLCHVDNGNLIFINGTTIPTNGTGTVTPDTTLRAELADDGDGTGSVACGSKLVYGDVQPGTKTPKNYTQGTLFAQLGQMLDWTNDHYKGLDATTKHSYKDLLNRPTYYVSPTTGEGDFTSLNAALNDATIRTNGGLIVLKNNVTFSENIVLGATLSKDVTVIGSNTTIQSSSAAAVFSQNAQTIVGILKFCGVYFVQTSNVRAIELNKISADAHSAVIFEDCYIYHAGSSAAAEMVLAYGNTEFHRCYFVDDNYTNGRYAIKVALTTANKLGRMIIRGCVFNNCGAVYGRSIGDAYSWGELVIEDCFIYNCGYSPNDSSFGTLINDISTGGYISISISRNRVQGSQATANSALFCGISNAGGLIADNVVLQGELQAVSSTSAWAIQAGGRAVTGEVGNISIRGNVLHTGKARGIAVLGDGDTILSNEIVDFDGPVASYALSASSASLVRIAGNIVRRSASSADALRGIYIAGSNCVIENNTIDFSGTGNLTLFGIYATSASFYNTITGNTLKMAGLGSTAIYVEGSHSRILGNYIYQTQYGIAGGSTSHLTIADNTILLVAPTSTTGVGIWFGQKSRATGNCIKFDTNTEPLSEGIHIYGSNCVVQGNTIEGARYGIDVDAYEGCCILGNFITSNACTTAGPIGIDLTAATKFAVSGNTIYLQDVTNAIGIDCARGSLTALHGSITGNTVLDSGTSNSTGRKGIDCTYCDYLSVSGNTIGPYVAFPLPIDTTSATGVGLGKNLSVPNVNTYNRYDEPI